MKHNKIKVAIILLSFAVVLVLAFSIMHSLQKTNEAVNTFNEESFPFILHYPNNWKLDEEKMVQYNLVLINSDSSLKIIINYDLEESECNKNSALEDQSDLVGTSICESELQFVNSREDTLLIKETNGKSISRLNNDVLKSDSEFTSGGLVKLGDFYQINNPETKLVLDSGFSLAKIKYFRVVYEYTNEVENKDGLNESLHEADEIIKSLEVKEKYK
jgi:hypothetical protein